MPASAVMHVLLCAVIGIARIFFKFWNQGVTIPEPGRLLKTLLSLLLPNDKLRQLECLGDIFIHHGLFQHEGYIYFVDPKLSQNAVNKLDKGATGYLENSPLSNSFLGSSDKRPTSRRLVASIFRKASMEEKGTQMLPVMETLVEKISKAPVINVSTLMLEMALDIVGRVLLRLDLNALNGEQDALIGALMTILHKAYALGEIGVKSQDFIKASDLLDRLTSRLLEEACRVDCEERTLAKILQEEFNCEQAKDNLKLFLMAGSETTAASIPIFLYLLTDLPDLQKALQAEADEYIDQLRTDAAIIPPQLESAMKELLRVYAIAPYISRQTYSDLQFGKFTIPKNSSLRIFTWGIHRSPELWASSKQFVPDRFCCDGVKRQNLTGSKPMLNRNAIWMPFGAGSRVCIGQHLAWTELRLTLTFLLHHFTFHRVKDTRILEFCVDWVHSVVHPKDDIILGAVIRKKALC